MSKIYLFSDPHFGHEKMAKRRGFSSAEEQDELIVKNWNKVLTKRDVCYILGDITMEKANYEILNRLNGIKKVVLGNHDKPQHVKKLLEYVNCVCGLYKLDNYILSHAPIHESEMPRFLKNIHGHVHENTIPDERYINVCAEAINYTPVQFSSISLKTTFL